MQRARYSSVSCFLYVAASPWQTEEDSPLCAEFYSTQSFRQMTNVLECGVRFDCLCFCYIIVAQHAMCDVNKYYRMDCVCVCVGDEIGIFGLFLVNGSWWQQNLLHWYALNWRTFGLPVHITEYRANWLILQYSHGVRGGWCEWRVWVFAVCMRTG